MIINFSHQKGGTGKSTISFHIVQAFKNKGYSVQLLDLDNQNSCIDANNLRDLPFDYVTSIATEKELVKAIEEVKKNEIIIIDSGGFDSSLTRIAIMGADINITPVADKAFELLAVINKYSVILEEIEAATDEETKTYILLNKIHIFAKNFDHLHEMIGNQKRMQILNTIIRDRAVYDKSIWEGSTVQEAHTLKGHEDASYEINKLAEELITIYEKGLQND